MRYLPTTLAVALSGSVALLAVYRGDRSVAFFAGAAGLLALFLS